MQSLPLAELVLLEVRLSLAKPNETGSVVGFPLLLQPDTTTHLNRIYQTSNKQTTFTKAVMQVVQQAPVEPVSSSQNATGLNLDLDLLDLRMNP